jgi:hypothetical protein
MMKEFEMAMNELSQSFAKVALSMDKVRELLGKMAIA